MGFPPHHGRHCDRIDSIWREELAHEHGVGCTLSFRPRECRSSNRDPLTIAKSHRSAPDRSVLGCVRGIDARDDAQLSCFTIDHGGLGRFGLCHYDLHGVHAGEQLGDGDDPLLDDRLIDRCGGCLQPRNTGAWRHVACEYGSDWVDNWDVPKRCVGGACLLFSDLAGCELLV